MTPLAERAAALLEVVEKMTPHGVFHFKQPFTDNEAVLRWMADLVADTRDGATELQGVGSGDPDGSWTVTALTGNGPDREVNAAGYAALKNYAPDLIRELLAENERLRSEGNRLRLLVTANLHDIEANERLLARVAELEAAPKVEQDRMLSHYQELKPTPFQGRTTRRD